LKSGHLIALASAAFILAWFFLFRPDFLGGPASYIIVSGKSMEPGLQSGDLVVVRRQADYQPGDVVAFDVGGGKVIHRIVEGSAEEGFVMRGDNNDGFDPWRPGEDDILGEMWFSVPRAGRLLAVLQSPVLLAGLASSVAVFLVLIGPEGAKSKRASEESQPQGGNGRRRFPWWRRLRRAILSLLPTVVLPAALAVLLGSGTGSAANLPVSGGTLQVFRFSLQVEPVAAEVDLRPDTLNAESEGQSVAAYIELSLPFDVADIDVPTVVLSIAGARCAVAAEGTPVEIGDEDGDGVADLMVKFDRAAVIALVAGREGDVMMLVSGQLRGGSEFQGADSVRVIHAATPTPIASPGEGAAIPSPAPPLTPTATATQTLEPTPTVEEPRVATPAPETPSTAEPAATVTSTPTPTPTPTRTPAPTVAPESVPVTEPTETPIPTPTSVI